MALTKPNYSDRSVWELNIKFAKCHINFSVAIYCGFILNFESFYSLLIIKVKNSNKFTPCNIAEWMEFGCFPSQRYGLFYDN